MTFLRWTLMTVGALGLSFMVPAGAMEKNTETLRPKSYRTSIAGPSRTVVPARPGRNTPVAVKSVDRGEEECAGSNPFLNCGFMSSFGKSIIFMMHQEFQKQGLSKQVSAEKIVSLHFPSGAYASPCNVMNSLVPVWNDLDPTTRNKWICATYLGRDRAMKRFVQDIILSGGIGLTIPGKKLFPYNGKSGMEFNPKVNGILYYVDSIDTTGLDAHQISDIINKSDHLKRIKKLSISGLSFCRDRLVYNHMGTLSKNQTLLELNLTNSNLSYHDVILFIEAIRSGQSNLRSFVFTRPVRGILPDLSKSGLHAEIDELSQQTGFFIAMQEPRAECGGYRW